MVESYRPLILVWAAIISLSAVGVITLQMLGPPAVRGLRQGGPQAVAPPLPPRADQPVAAASLPAPAVVEQPVLAPLAPAVPVLPSHRRMRSWVRRGASPAKVLDGLGIGDEDVLAERGQSGPQSGPVPQARDALPPPATPNPRSQVSAYQHVAGYIGIFTTGADGSRVFRATP